MSTTSFVNTAKAKNSVRALLIDMDGVLFDTESMSINLIIDVVARQNLTITREFIIQNMGIGPADLLSTYSKHLGPTFDSQLYWNTYWEERNKYYDEKGIPLMKGALSLLKAANEKHIPCILASSSPQKQVFTCLRRTGIDKYFSDVVGGDMFAHSKPQPDIYLKAAELAGVDISDCLVLEDSLNGMKAGRAAGALVAMIPDIIPFSEATKPFCDYLCESLLDVVQLL